MSRIFFKNEVEDKSKNKSDYFHFMSTVRGDSRATNENITINKSEIQFQDQSSRESESEFKRYNSLSDKNSLLKIESECGQYIYHVSIVDFKRTQSKVSEV